MDRQHPAHTGTFRRCTHEARCRVCHLLIEHPEECSAIFEVIVSLDDELSTRIEKLSRLFAGPGLVT